MFEFNKNSSIHSQIYDDVISKIISGDIESDAKMESIRSLAHYYSVNPNTVQRVISDLEREGLVVIQRGIGTIVSNSVKIGKLRRSVLKRQSTEFTDRLTNMGFDQNQIIEAIKGCMKYEDK